MDNKEKLKVKVNKRMQEIKEEIAELAEQLGKENIDHAVIFGWKPNEKESSQYFHGLGGYVYLLLGQFVNYPVLKPYIDALIEVYLQFRGKEKKELTKEQFEDIIIELGKTIFELTNLARNKDIEHSMIFAFRTDERNAKIFQGKDISMAKLLYILLTDKELEPFWEVAMGAAIWKELKESPIFIENKSELVH